MTMITIIEPGVQIAELEKEDSRTKTTILELKKQVLSADLKIQELQEQLTTVEEKLKTQVQRAEAAEFECAAHIQTIRELNAEVRHLETTNVFLFAPQDCAEQWCRTAPLLTRERVFISTCATTCSKSHRWHSRHLQKALRVM